jgi:long-chain acyl-CoA synthetase
MNLSAALEHSTRENPKKTAIIFDDMRLDFGQVNAAANQIANGLSKSGIGKGDKVALSCPNLPYFPMIYYGILKTGAIVVPLNVLLKGREIAYHLDDSDAKAYLCFQGTPELPMADEGYKGFQAAASCKHMWIITADPAAPSPIKEIPAMAQLIAGQSLEFDTIQCLPNDTAVILYTSGTTGMPKGAELSHSNLIMNAKAGSELLQLTHDDIQIVVLPLFHSFGQTVQMNAGFATGNTLVLIPRFTPDAVLSAIQHKKATVFAGVPTMYWQLLTYEDQKGQFDIDKISEILRIGVSGGSSLALEIIRGIEKKYQIPIIEGYGLSETSPLATFNHLGRERKQGSVGMPIWGVEIKIFNDSGEEMPVDGVGEIAVRGHNVMKGYYNKPEETKAAFNGSGWFYTGDLGKKDADGYIYIVDRVKDMIIRGGFNIYPRELEEVLMTHPSVSMAAVIGIPHDQHGEEVKAFVMLKDNETVTENEIVQWAKAQMAAYKYPRIVEICEKLPMTATGKILKKELKAEIRPN